MEEELINRIGYDPRFTTPRDTQSDYPGRAIRQAPFRAAPGGGSLVHGDLAVSHSGFAALISQSAFQLAVFLFLADKLIAESEARARAAEGEPLRSPLSWPNPLVFSAAWGGPPISCTAAPAASI